MVKSKSKGKSSNPSRTTRKANALGYAKRQSFKSKALGPGGLSDVYEYQQEKVRRAKVKPLLFKDEIGGMGGPESGDEDGDESVPSKKRDVRPRLVGENDDDNGISEDEDEEIDSDEAFEESDEERFADYNFSSRRKESDPDEEMEMADDSEAEEEDDKEDDEEEEEEDANQDHTVSASEAEEGEDAALHDLDNFVAGLDVGQKRKATDEDEAGDISVRARKRRLLPERTEAGAENEFAAVPGGGKLKLDDLLAPLEGQSSNLTSLKKSAKVLASSSGKIQTLSAPLPQRTAERLDREAAYEQTKGEVDKWKGTMRRIQEAEHLSFPLQAESKSRTSNLELAAKFKPTTELESAVDKLLKTAKMCEDEISQTETLKMNHLSVEEVSARRAELAKMRDLMFRAEAKAKRVAKIKSKTYRRIRKKERARLAEKLGEGEDDDMDDEEARLKREVERARERATLRHKNTGKWAKAMRMRGELEEDQRRDINEMLDRGDKLRRRIRGEDERGDEDSEDDESDGEEGEEDISRIKAKAFDELAALPTGQAEVLEGKKGKSVFEMKFMKDAMAREQWKANEIVDDFIREMGGVNEAEDENVPQGIELPQDVVAVQRTGGRVVYRPGAFNTNLRPVGSLASDTSSATLKSSDFPPEADAELSASPPHSPPLLHGRPVPALEAEVNPWLAPSGGPSKAAQSKHEVAVSKQSGMAEKSKNRLRKRVKNRLEEKEKAQVDATVDISMSTAMTLSGPSKAAESSKYSAPQSSFAVKLQASRVDDVSDSDANSELEEQERVAARKGKGKGKATGVKAFEQRDLVALAFAGDNVVQDFVEAKRREMAEDAPKEIDTTLAGWGSWGGAGAKKVPPRPYLVKKVAGIDPTSRADYKKAHVIISEKRDKKAAKYLVKDLPYPYTSRSQFERSMEVSIGTEWNTRLGFQRATLPKVVTKMGTLIAPLEKHT